MRCFLIFTAICLFSAISARGEDQQLLQEVEQLLTGGFQPERVALEKLASAYESAVQRLGRQDPVLEYAYSIVLRKNFAGHEGQELLEAAAASNSPIVFQAKEELIRQQLREKRYLTALPLLLKHTQVIGAVPAGSPQEADAQQSAEWIGGIYGYLAGPVGVSEVSQKAIELEPEFLTSLGDTYQVSFQRGWVRVEMIRQKLNRQVDEAQQAAAAVQQTTTDQMKASVKDIEAQKQEVKDQALKFEDVAVDDLSDLDSKIGVLEKQFEANLRAEQTMIVTATALRLEIGQLENLLTAPNADVTVRASRLPSPIQQGRIQSLRDQLAFRQNELLVLSRDYALLLDSRNTVVQMAQNMIARRNQLAGQYQSTANVANAQIQRLTRMQERMKQAVKKAEKNPVLTQQVKTQSRLVADLNSYDQSGLQLERERLLASLSPNP